MIDTIAATIRLDRDVPLEHFEGATSYLNVRSREASERYYLNEEGRPRVTWWPAMRLLRVELSVPNLLGVEGNVRHVDVEQALHQVDEFLRVSVCEGLPGYADWKCTRVDYAVNIPVGERVRAYLAALGELRLSTMLRHPFPDGVVFKAKSRWVKFYRKEERVLRFEVSNYRDSVRYMARAWFGGDRSVANMVAPGHAMYVLLRYWEDLGLGEPFASDACVVDAMREAFGARSLAGARHALECIRKHGTDAYKSLSLMSKSSYYRWFSKLREHGFLARNDDDALGTLRFPLVVVNDAIRAQHNLNSSASPPIPYALQQNRAKNLWVDFAAALGVKPGVRPIGFLVRPDERSDLDRTARPVPQGGAKSTVSLTRALSAVAAAS